MSPEESNCQLALNFDLPKVLRNRRECPADRILKEFRRLQRLDYMSNIKAYRHDRFLCFNGIQIY